MNFSILPKKLAGDLSSVADDARSVFDRLDDVQAELDGLAQSEVTYASMHASVRTLERQIRLIEGEMKDAKKEAQRSDDKDKVASLEAAIDVFEGEVEALRAQIPAEWEDAQSNYQAQLKALAKSQRKYRGALDDGYQPVRDLIIMIGEEAGLTAFQPRISSLLSEVANLADKDAAAVIKEFEGEMRSVGGINPVKSLLSKARRDLTKGKTEQGRGRLAEVEALMSSEIAWRKEAASSLMPALIAYRDETASTIGLRSQSRLPDEIVPRISSCKALHRDISLRF